MLQSPSEMTQTTAIDFVRALAHLLGSRPQGQRLALLATLLTVALPSLAWEPTAPVELWCLPAPAAVPTRWPASSRAW